MALEPFSTEVTDNGSALTVTVTGDVDAATCPALSDVLAAAVRTGRDVMVDLGSVAFLDSSGLNCLLQGQRRAADSGASLLVTATSSVVESLLRRTGLFGILTQPNWAEG